MIENAKVPILGFAAYSGTGKTTLLVRLLPLLAARGLRVGMIKHAHHDFDIDQPGKDSFELRKAGANPMLVASRRRWALMTETPGRDEPRLGELLARLDGSSLDLILVEGFKHEPIPKIELHRPALGHPLMYPGDPNIVAIASDTDLDPRPPIPVLEINRAEDITTYILGRITGRI